MINKTRYTDIDYNKFNRIVYETDFGLNNTDYIEFHLYNIDDSLIISEPILSHLYWKHHKNNKQINSISLDLKNIFSNLNISRGEFIVRCNFFRKVISNELYIKQIRRNEVELRSIVPINLSYLNELISNNIKDFVLNLGDNRIYQIVNIEVVNDKILKIKLYKDLIADLKSNCTLNYEVVYPFEDKILIIDKQSSYILNNTVLYPNLDIVINDFSNVHSDYKNWNSLLGSKLSVLDNILSTQVIDSIKLNIQYNEFENFIHYSSAKERVVNFKYKLQQLENYENELYTLTDISGSVIPFNIVEVYNKRNDIINSFDAFEKFLYYDISGSLYTHVTGSYNTWPKQVGQKKIWEQKLESWNTIYTLPNYENNQLTVSASINIVPYSITSSEGIAYYNDLYLKAQLYDDSNKDSLINYIPDFIKVDNENESFLLFINMIGQHFDLIWLYIKELQNIFSIEQHPKDGTSLQLIYNLAEMLGWKLDSKLSSTELYDYILGYDSIGSSKSWNNQLEAKSKIELTIELWKRIVNNLPLIMKSKGTKRSVQALLSCYGIPDTLLKVKEFGKSSIDDSRKPIYQDESFKYALNFNNATNTYLSVPWGEVKQTSEYPTAIEFRIKMDTDYDYPDSYEETILEIK